MWFFWGGQLRCILYICLNCPPTLAPRAAILLLSWFSILVLEETKFSFPINKMCALVIRVLRARPRGPTCFLAHWASPIKAGPRATMDIYTECSFQTMVFPSSLIPWLWCLERKLCFLRFCVRIPFLSAYASYELCPKPHKGHKTSKSWFAPVLFQYDVKNTNNEHFLTLFT